MGEIVITSARLAVYTYVGESDDTEEDVVAEGDSGTGTNWFVRLRHFGVVTEITVYV
jgi:hypothetical protein